jgi:hypothetical protein
MVDAAAPPLPERRLHRPRDSDSGQACEGDGGDSDGQGTALEGGGCGAPPYLVRAAEILRGFKGSRGQYHEKISASTLFLDKPILDKPNRKNPAIFPVWCFSRLCVYMARGGDTPQRKWSLEQRLVFECVEACPFPRSNKAPKIAPKWGFDKIRLLGFTTLHDSRRYATFRDAGSLTPRHILSYLSIYLSIYLSTILSYLILSDKIR